MAHAVETELVERLETLRPEALGRHDSPDKAGTEKQEPKSKAPRGNRSRWILLFAVALALTGGIVWWLNSRNYESTDDAQIEGHLNLVSARVSGTVSYINPRVENNQFVEAGTLLLELDPRDHEAELEHARANFHTRSAEARSALVT